MLGTCWGIVGKLLGNDWKHVGKLLGNCLGIVGNMLVGIFPTSKIGVVIAQNANDDVQDHSRNIFEKIMFRYVSFFL